MFLERFITDNISDRNTPLVKHGNFEFTDYGVNLSILGESSFMTKTICSDVLCGFTTDNMTCHELQTNSSK